MRLRWTALLALLICALPLGSCSSTSTTAIIYPTPVITGLFPLQHHSGQPDVHFIYLRYGLYQQPAVASLLERLHAHQRSE